MSLKYEPASEPLGRRSARPRLFLSHVPSRSFPVPQPLRVKTETSPNRRGLDSQVRLKTDTTPDKSARPSLSSSPAPSRSLPLVIGDLFTVLWVVLCFGKAMPRLRWQIPPFGSQKSVSRLRSFPYYLMQRYIVLREDGMRAHPGASSGHPRPL